MVAPASERLFYRAIADTDFLGPFHSGKQQVALKIHLPLLSPKDIYILLLFPQFFFNLLIDSFGVFHPKQTGRVVGLTKKILEIKKEYFCRP